MSLDLRPEIEKTKGGCFDCRYLIKGYESWEMPHIEWWECKARPANEMLKGFPWKKTKCKYRKETK